MYPKSPPAREIAGQQNDVSFNTQCSIIIWADVAADEAGGLAGTPFAPGGAAPEPAPGGLSGGAIAGIIVGAIAGAVLIFFAVRKWVWRSQQVRL